MIIITDGLVIKETNTKENDKVITILTRDRGIIRAFANNAKKINNPKSLFCFVLRSTLRNFSIKDEEDSSFDLLGRYGAADGDNHRRGMLYAGLFAGT